jgi:hypothetical protein
VCAAFRHTTGGRADRHHYSAVGELGGRVNAWQHTRLLSRGAGASTLLGTGCLLPDHHIHASSPMLAQLQLRIRPRGGGQQKNMLFYPTGRLSMGRLSMRFLDGLNAAREASWPALRHLDMMDGNWMFKLDDICRTEWEAWGLEYMRAAQRLATGHAAALRTLSLGVFLVQGDVHAPQDLVAAERAFLQDMLTSPLPALERLLLRIQPLPLNLNQEQDGDCLEALRPLSHLSMPRLTQLRLDVYGVHSDDAAAELVRLAADARLPALRHLSVAVSLTALHPRSWIKALAAPRWAAL